MPIIIFICLPNHFNYWIYVLLILSKESKGFLRIIIVSFVVVVILIVIVHVVVIISFSFVAIFVVTLSIFHPAVLSLIPVFPFYSHDASLTVWPSSHSLIPLVWPLVLLTCRPHPAPTRPGHPSISPPHVASLTVCPSSHSLIPLVWPLVLL